MPVIAARPPQSSATKKGNFLDIITPKFNKRLMNEELLVAAQGI